VAGWGGAGDDSEAARIEREVYAEFERRHPGVEIQRENIPGSQDYVRKLLLSFIAGAEPDIIRLDASSAAVFIDNGALMDLTPFIEGENGIDLNDYFPNVTNIARRGDALYAIPIDFTPMVVYYNRRLFDEARVPYPEPGWTWDDFLSKAKALTREGRYGTTFANWMPGWLPWVWAGGGDVLGPTGKAVGAADSEATVRAVTWLRDLVTVHKVAPSLSQMAAEGAAPFANAQAAMETSGHWNLVTLASAPKVKLKEVGVAPIPVARKGMPPTTVIYESGWSIGKNCRNPELAWEFIRYYTSAEVQRKLQKTGIGICARKDIAQERAVDEREQDFLRIVPSGREPWGARVEGYDYVESEGQKAMDAILRSGRDPRQVLREFARAVDRQLARR
jgi:multiple sugar transport system substrate-binding protein